MNKIFIISAFTITLISCSAYQTAPYEKDKSPKDRGQYTGVEGSIQKQRDQAQQAQEANKFKCQDARLDLVDAEAEGDQNIIRRVKARVQKLCVVEK